MHELLPALQSSLFNSYLGGVAASGPVQLILVSSPHAKGLVVFSPETLHAALLLNGPVLQLHGG